MLILTLNITLSYMISMPAPIAGEQLVLYYLSYIILLYNFNLLICLTGFVEVDLFPSTKIKNKFEHNTQLTIMILYNFVLTGSQINKQKNKKSLC